MNQYITGTTIKELREKCGFTQSELAGKLMVSDKTVSKWETGRGYPDITLLEPLAEVFGVSVMEILSGETIENTNVSANMLRGRFYVCPVCGNVIHSTGQAVISCHGIVLNPLEAERADFIGDSNAEQKEDNVSNHIITVEKVEDEYYVTVDHEMTKQHYISFIAAASPDRTQIVKLYPEGNAEARFKKFCVKNLYYYCNRDGLFCADIRKMK